MNLRNKESKAGDHRMNGHVELKRSCRVRKSQFAHLNQSLLFDQLVNRSGEPVILLTEGIIECSGIHQWALWSQHCWSCPAGNGQHQQHQAEPRAGAPSHVERRHWRSECDSAPLAKKRTADMCSGQYVDERIPIVPFLPAFQENMDMYSRVKRRKSLRRNTYSIQAHHKAMSKTEQEEEEEEEGTEGQIHINVLQTGGLCGEKQHPCLPHL